jgi:hypothetical protein
MNLRTLLDNRCTGQAGALLKGSDVPTETKTLTAEIAEVRESPEEFNAPIIIVFKKPVCGKSAWAVNKTNLKALIKIYGDDAKQLVGKKIKLEIISVRNPQTGEIVRSLAVSPKKVKPAN